MYGNDLGQTARRMPEEVRTYSLAVKLGLTTACEHCFAKVDVFMLHFAKSMSLHASAHHPHVIAHQTRLTDLLTQGASATSLEIAAILSNSGCICALYSRSLSLATIQCPKCSCSSCSKVSIATLTQHSRAYSPFPRLSTRSIETSSPEFLRCCFVRRPSSWIKPNVCPSEPSWCW
jgi:hypothetical protein